MSNLNGRTVLTATMHDGIFVPGCGEIKKELTSKDTGLSKGAKMTIDEPFLVVELEGKDRQTYTIPIPLTNFKNLVVSKQVVLAPTTKD